MGFTYKPLLKLLIDQGKNKEDLRVALSLGRGTIAKLGKDEYVSLEVLDKICTYLECKIEDVIEYQK